MPESKLWYISNSDLFASLSQEEKMRTMQNSRMFTMKKGESMQQTLAPANNVYLIKEGVVKLVAPCQRGKEIILGFLQMGDLMGRVIPDDPDEGIDAIAEQDVLLCEIPMPVFEELLSKYPDVALTITKWIGLRFRRIQKRFCSLIFATPKERVANILLELMEDFGRRLVDGQIRLELKLTHKEIAQLVGLTRESVTHVLGEFENEGIIAVLKRQIYLLDLERLRAVEQPRTRQLT